MKKADQKVERTRFRECEEGADVGEIRSGTARLAARRAPSTVRWGRGRFATAVATLPVVVRPERPDGPPPDSPPLVRALWWQRRCCFTWASVDEFRAVGAAWDALPREDALRAELNARAQTLGVRIAQDEDAPPDAPPPDPAMTVLSSLWHTAVQQLAQLCVVRHWLPPAEGQTLSAVRGVVGELLYKELQYAVVQLAEPSRDAVLADPVEGWVRFEHVRALEDTLVSGAPEGERALVFDAVYGPALGFAAWVYNRQEQRLLGHCIMRWLLELGAGVASPTLDRTLRDNVALGY